MLIGVLDIQGSVEEHVASLRACGVEAVLVKSAEQIEKLDGLIIPGGESTTIFDLMSKYKIDVAIKKNKGLAIWGTCAGAILLSKMKLMNIEVERNAYGSQIASFETELKVNSKTVKAIFIRAPKIIKTSKESQILAQYDGSPVMVQEGNKLATTFHPELTNDLTVHKYFLSLC